MPTEEQTLYEVPLPAIVGATHIGDPAKPGSRVTGAPSQKYPILRDLAASPAQITVEVDTELRRYIGAIKMVTEGTTGDGSRLILVPSLGPLPGQRQSERIAQSRDASVPLPKIIAFRVLKIEVTKLPAVL